MAMSDNQDVSGLVGAIIISSISSAISIAQRMLRGYPASAIWFFSESLSAILCGYLVWDIYPHIAESLPLWASQHLMIAFAAHMGGRCFQWLEKFLNQRTGIEIPIEEPPKPTRRKPRVNSTQKDTS